MTQGTQDFSSLKFLVNGVSFDPPDVPVLLQILNGVPPSQLLPNGSIYPVGGNKSVEVSIPASAVAPGGPVSMKSTTKQERPVPGLLITVLLHF